MSEEEEVTQMENESEEGKTYDFWQPAPHKRHMWKNMGKIRALLAVMFFFYIFIKIC